MLKEENFAYFGVIFGVLKNGFDDLKHWGDTGPTCNLESINLLVKETIVHEQLNKKYFLVRV